MYVTSNADSAIISDTPQRTTPNRPTRPLYTDSIPWSSRGSLYSGPLDRSPNGPALLLMADPNLPPSATNSVWNDNHTITSFGMETEIVENDDVDEDLLSAMDAVQSAHMRRITHYKRLLEQGQSSAASQLHALQAELKLLRGTLDKERAISHENELARDRDRLALTLQKKETAVEELPFDLASILRGDGKGGFNESDVRRAIRSLQIPERMRLIGIILDCCIPGDISQQIRLLEKYRKSTFDVLTNLPTDIALTILRFLSVQQLLGIETVCKKWQELVHNPVLWRHNCLVLTATDPIPLRPPARVEDWEALYKSLHHRESNWKNAVPQHIRFLNGHTKFCTRLLLRGKRLISGSYDETIRIWDIETGEEKKCLQVQKAVSCLDFLAEEEVFAVGFHDVGRVHLYSSVTFNPLQQLQGHLYGIRSVALSPKHLISAGADKALVAWDWRNGEKIVKFGQQTNQNIGVQILRATTPRLAEEVGERFVSVTIDGIVRVFSIKRREMISSFNLASLGAGNPVLAAKISQVGANANNMLQWFAAEGNQMTCSTKSLIMHLQWVDESDLYNSPAGQPSTLSSPTTSSGPKTPSSTAPSAFRSQGPNPLKRSGGSSSGPTAGNGTQLRRSSGPLPRLSVPAPTTPRAPNLSNSTPIRPSPRIVSTGSKGPVSPAARKSSLTSNTLPRIIAIVETPDIASGAVDPRKRRVVTATRFGQRTDADRRIFLSTHRDRVTPPPLEEIEELAGESGAEKANDDPARPSLSHSRRSSVSTVHSAISNTSTTSPPLRGHYHHRSSMVDFDTTVDALGGVWAELASFDPLDPNAVLALKSVEGVSGDLPAKFRGLATPAMNPMSFALSHEEVVVGCADGTIYVMNFVGYKYSRSASQAFDIQLESPTTVEEYDDATPPTSAFEHGGPASFNST